MFNYLSKISHHSWALPLIFTIQNSFYYYYLFIKKWYLEQLKEKEWREVFMCLKEIKAWVGKWQSQEFNLGGDVESKINLKKLIDINSKLNTQIYINVIWRLI